ncbi:hypothetical protein SEVIR_2G414650v4 [Setaria viridis]
MMNPRFLARRSFRPFLTADREPLGGPEARDVAGIHWSIRLVATWDPRPHFRSGLKAQIRWASTFLEKFDQTGAKRKQGTKKKKKKTNAYSYAYVLDGKYSKPWISFLFLNIKKPWVLNWSRDERCVIDSVLLEHVEAGDGVYGGSKASELLEYSSTGADRGRCRARDLYGYLTTGTTVTESGGDQAKHIYIYMCVYINMYM